MITTQTQHKKINVCQKSQLDGLMAIAMLQPRIVVVIDGIKHLFGN